MSDIKELLSPARVARTVLITIGLVALARLLWQGRDILFIVFFGVLVAIFFSVFVEPMVKRGVPRAASVLIVLVAFAGIVGLFGWALWPTVQEQLEVVAGDLPQAAGQAADWVEQQYQGISESFGVPPAEAEQQLRTRLSQQTGQLVGGALPVLNTAMGAVAGILIVLMAGVYMAADPRLYRKGMVRLLPPRHRDRVGEAFSRTASSLRHWMVGTIISMVIVGLLSGLGLWILGVPAPLALAVIAGLLEFIPIFGPILAAVPAIAVGLTVSPMTAVWVALLYTAIQQLEGDVITPLVMRGAARLPPALTLLFQSFMAVIFGFLGLLLAVPILAAGMALVQTLYVEPLEERR